MVPLIDVKKHLQVKVEVSNDIDKYPDEEVIIQ